MLKKILYGIAGLVVIGAIGALTLYLNPKVAQWVFLKPWAAFDVANVPPAPDYAQSDTWAALPTTQDNADVVPPESGAVDRQAEAVVDVFFVHPTTYYQKDMWNARYDEPDETMQFLDDGVLRHQAAVFNGSARVYAPRYRQATLYAFMGEEPDAYSALEFAYGDVERAFDYYIENLNDGRPFILASHSQGSLHGMKLLQDKIAGTNLANRMVAAYIVGFSIPEELGAEGVGPCREAHTTGCYLNWNSVSAEADNRGWKETTKIWIDGKLQLIAGRKIACVNPITGSLGGSADASANLGAQPFADSEEAVRAVRAEATGASCNDGMLIVAPPSDDDGFTYGTFGEDFHIYDYNLFHMNMRADISRRVDAFWKR